MTVCWSWTWPPADIEQREAYQALRGYPPPESSQRLCTTPNCIRGDHLGPVPTKETA